LNESAGTFFNVLQDVLLHDVQLSLSKLGDPADSGSRENMTLEALHKVLLAAGEATAADKMKASMQASAEQVDRPFRSLNHAECRRHPKNGALAGGDRERIGSPT